jgi:hypothetical protein
MTETKRTDMGMRLTCALVLAFFAGVGLAVSGFLVDAFGNRCLGNSIRQFSQQGCDGHSGFSGPGLVMMIAGVALALVPILIGLIYRANQAGS